MLNKDRKQPKDIDEVEESFANKEKNVPFKDHPITKLMALMTSADHSIIYRVTPEQYENAKKWGLV